jgi:addiction module HigA family antidote
MSDKEAKIVQSADAKTVKDWYDRNEILLVDVRETSEFEVEHIPGALLLPLSSFDPEFFPTLPGKKIIIHCAVGKRSEAAGKMLLNEGHPGIIHMTGGMDAWKAAGYATEVQILPPDSGIKEAPTPLFLCPPPGYILNDEYLTPLGISQSKLAGAIGISEEAVAALVAHETTIDVELSLRLARYFSTSADFWIRLQTEHDLEQARYEIGEKLRQEISPRTATE